MKKVSKFFSSGLGKGLISIAIVIGGVMIMQVLANTEKVSHKKAPVRNYRMVEVLAPEYRDHRLEISGNGTVRSVNELTITSAVRGKITYSKNDLKAGTYVSKDEVILEIDPREAENNVFLARANLINAIVALIPDFVSSEDRKYYEKWTNYLSRLDIESSTPDLPEVTEQREKIKVSLRNIYSMYYNVKNAELMLSYHRIRAPFEGHLSSDGILTGTFVNPGQQLAVLHDAVNIEVSVPLAISEFNALNLHEGTEVLISANENEGHSLQGIVSRYNTALNTYSQSVSVHIRMRNSDLDPAFFPGNFVDVKIPGKVLENVCRLPRHLLDMENRIYIADDFRLQSMPVEVLASQGDYIYTNTAIPSDIRIVTTKMQKALPGMDLRFEDPLGILYADEEIDEEDKLTKNDPANSVQG